MIKPLNTRQRQQIRNLNAAALVNHLANHHTGFADMLAALVYWVRCGGADDIVCIISRPAHGKVKGGCIALCRRAARDS